MIGDANLSHLQIMFNIVAVIAGVLATFFLTRVWNRADDLEKSLTEQRNALTELRVEVARDYVSAATLTKILADQKDMFAELFGTRLSRVEAKIDAMMMGNKHTAD